MWLQYPWGTRLRRTRLLFSASAKSALAGQVYADALAGN
jgi:hypothetical protein